MIEEESGPIRPRSVPLSHTRADTPPPVSQAPGYPIGRLAVIALLLGLLIAVFVGLPRIMESPPSDSAVEGSIAIDGDAGAAARNPDTGSTRRDPPTNDSQPPPFASLMREQAREGAQAQLASFVERQIALEQEMQVGAWGSSEFDAAKALATRGDQLFMADQFEQSLEAYREASELLAVLMEKGRDIVSESVERGERALDERDQQLAMTSFQEALAIDPDNSSALSGLSRAENLPEVIDVLRRGKNQELAGQWQEALGSYEQVRSLDPQTRGIDELIDGARRGVTDTRARELLSKAFSELEAGRFDSARAAFREVLSLRPGDSIALGGLEQVAERGDLSKIDRLKRSAAEAESQEQWQQAIDSYDAVLALDTNIQFAKDGRSRSLTQQRTALTLGNMIASPDKLSSSELLTDAGNILARAQALSPRGPKLAEQITRVEELLRIYATPLPVVLLSDNVTQVTLSTIGRIGTFTRKELSLRPGAYTLIGSRDGYRDIRASILVRPSMAPIDVRCNEAI